MALQRITVLITFLAVTMPSFETSIAAPPERQPPPTRRFDAPGSPAFVWLDGKPGLNPPLETDGNFLICPEYLPAPENKVAEGVPQGKVQQFSINSKDTTLFNPGIARKVFGTVDPNNQKTLIVETHEIDYTRQITVHIPAQYVSGTQAPFMVIHDGPKGKPNMGIPQILDNLIA